MSNVLSQEEINALLNDTFAKNSPGNDDTPEKLLSDMEIDTLGEIANISMGSAATALSSLLGKRVEITTPQVDLTTLDDIRNKYDKSYVIVDVNYNEGLKGSNVLIIQTYDAGVFVDLMMGGDGSNPMMELNDLHLSAVSEAMNQMMGASCTSLSQILNKRIDISPPVLDLYQLKDYQFHITENEKIVKMAFRVVIKDLVDSEMMQLLPTSFAKSMVEDLFNANGMTKSQPAQSKTENEFNKSTKPTPPAQITQIEQPPISRGQTVQNEPLATPEYREEPPRTQVTVSPVEYPRFSQGSVPSSGLTNFDLILDVGLQLSVELGRTHKKIKDILELSHGSILELDKIAGEPVDIMVNDKLLAKGEVVIIDEKFGVRVTEILSPMERVKNLK